MTLKPLEKVYWLRLLLGIVAALACIGYEVAMGTITRDPNSLPLYSTLFYGISIALVVYMLSIYAVKFKFVTMVEKPQKLWKTGIGVYMLSWVTFWVLLYTIIAGLV
jgi:hypothetical protein